MAPTTLRAENIKIAFTYLSVNYQFDASSGLGFFIFFILLLLLSARGQRNVNVNSMVSCSVTGPEAGEVMMTLDAMSGN